MIKEHDCVVLTSDIPTDGLKAGDVGTVVHIHRAGTAFEVEFMTLTGETIDVVTLAADAIRPVREREIAHVRQVA